MRELGIGGNRWPARYRSFSLSIADGGEENLQKNACFSKSVL